MIYVYKYLNIAKTLVKSKYLLMTNSEQVV